MLRALNGALAETGEFMSNTTIKGMQPEERPREKFLAYGPKALTDAELLAIILRTGSREQHSVGLSSEILTKNNDSSIINIFDYELEDLTRIKGIGQVKAIQIKAIGELSLRIAQKSKRKSISFTSPDIVADYYMEQLRHKKKEEVVLLLLNSANELIKEIQLSVGTVNASIFSSREIFIEAIRYEAVNMIILHNHPSGSPNPSKNDIACTENLCSAAGLLGLGLIDHIIIGDRCFFSFRKEGILNA